MASAEDHTRWPSALEKASAMSDDPDAMKIEGEVDRAGTEYIPLYQRFMVKKKSFVQQFSHIYLKRLLQTRERVLASAKAQCTRKDIQFVSKIIDLRDGDSCVVVGTIYKDMPKKPAALDEFLEEEGTIKKASNSNYTSDEDILVLEDESGRVRLEGDSLPVHKLITGVVVAVEGTVQPTGELDVSQIYYAGLPPQPPLPTVEKDRYVVLLSGLRLNESSNMLPMQLVVDYILGHLGGATEHAFQSQISRVIITGCSLAVPKDTGMKKNYSDPVMEAMRQLDLIISQLCSGVAVDLMPGEHDPSNMALPQQPFHRCLFPAASRYSSFRNVTNPYECDIDGVRFLGSSGQPVSNVQSYTRDKSSVQVLEDCLTWSHIAPSCPDSLACYPFYYEDPFVLEETPHVFFAGSQEKFETRLVEGKQGQRTRLICVPKFLDTATIVLVNLRTLDCHPIQFDGSLEP